MKKKLPCYPLVTVDPFFTIWSPSQKLNEADTMLWPRITKRFTGLITVDGKTRRFMGKGSEDMLNQVSVDLTPLITTYCFEAEKYSLKVEFFTPLFTEDIYLISIPCSYIRTTVAFKDDAEHTFSVRVHISDDMCFAKKRDAVTKEIVNKSAISYAKMGRKHQKPLHCSGDRVAADWGYTCICGEKVAFDDFGIYAESNKTVENFVVAFDDVKSIEYMGMQYEGVWKEKWHDISSAIAYSRKSADELFARAEKENEKQLAACAEFGEDYQFITAAAYRQIHAGHKLIRRRDGELLWLSKECASNGCINTVDVSYPSIPYFLLNNPVLVKAMMNGICEFARSDAWNYEFAPHDIGRYPLADGQVYGMNSFVDAFGRNTTWKKMWKKDGSLYKFESQMPVEECGNMLVMAYTYYLFSDDKKFLSDNADLFDLWASYLKKVGVVLANQLCTDDFAGHSEKNVNLAIKGVMGLACAGKIFDVLGKETSYASAAKMGATELKSYILPDGSLPFSLDKPDTWSIKYNLVWDKVLDFGLFDSSLYQAEADVCKKHVNRYGTPLDFRASFTKTDWMLWAAVLDAGNELTEIFSKCIVDYFEDTKETVVFSDFPWTEEPKHKSFMHRTVQGGLWFPVLAKKLQSMQK